MPHIVAATDFSPRSLRAVRRAGLVARQCKGTLTLLHVVDSDQPESMVALERREAERYLNEQAELLAELRGADCRVAVATADAFGGILQVAREESADLIVMGAHRKALLRDVFTGTTIERVIRYGSHPVLMVNNETVGPYRSVLAAVDMSEPCARAMETANMLGLTDGAQVTVVHAFIPPAKLTLAGGSIPQAQIARYVEAERHEANVQLSAFLAAHKGRSENRSYRIEEGNPFEVISRVAKETESELIVMGTHGYGGAAKVLLGSVAEEVLRTLDVDILAAPPGS